MVIKNQKSQLRIEKAKIVTMNLTVVKYFINATQLLLSSSENSDYELNCG